MVHFNKAMIDLIREIRRRVDSEAKPSIKLANPYIFDELIEIYADNDDAVLKALIKELVLHAGEPWFSRLSAPETPVEAEDSRVYRGQATAEQASPASEKKSGQKTIVYRGQVMLV